MLNHEIHENIVPRKFGAIRYILRGEIKVNSNQRSKQN